ncbi:MAG: RNA methyltransferase [Treponema sp.]|jgi:tRNA/rRNA methyltransferase/tRNA (cytidine32/uridine32-2'-O)-methyltransferase|nr:RNA methyltransferase [Treponema sp.]
MVLNDLVIVLCRPSEPGNVGAVCRTMKNMGLSRLRVIAADMRQTGGIIDETIRARAVHAAEIWKNAAHFSTLAEALADCGMAVGVTRRRGRRRKSVTLPPREAAEFLRGKNGSAALVFGSERTGLDDGELALCNIASHIPAGAAFPSLNLSHAVQIYAYEFFLALQSDTPDKKQNMVASQWHPMNRGEVVRRVKKISDTLAKMGFYKHPGREEQEVFLCDLMLRAGLTLEEGRYLGSIIAKSGRLAGN